MGSDATDEGGDATAGFRVVQEAWAGTVRVEGWGFWSPTVAKAFEASAIEACRTAGRAFVLFADFGRLTPQGPDGQTALQGLVNASREANAAQGVVFVANAVTKLQLVRIVKECGVHSWTYFATENAALTALSAGR